MLQGKSYIGVSLDDLIAVGMVAFHFAVTSFDLTKNSFYPYWKISALRNMADEIRDNSYTGKAKMFNGISLDYEMQDGNDLSEILGEKDINLEVNLIQEDFYNLANKVSFTKSEKEVFFLFVFNQLDIDQISQMINVSEKQVRRLLRSARIKFSTEYKKIY